MIIPSEFLIVSLKLSCIFTSTSFANDISILNYNVVFLQFMYIFVCITGQAWAAATTEGLLIYSLDSGMMFDPFQLEMNVTPDSIKKTLAEGDFSKGDQMILLYIL